METVFYQESITEWAAIRGNKEEGRIKYFTSIGQYRATWMEKNGHECMEKFTHLTPAQEWIENGPAREKETFWKQLGR